MELVEQVQDKDPQEKKLNDLFANILNKVESELKAERYKNNCFETTKWFYYTREHQYRRDSRKSWYLEN